MKKIVMEIDKEKHIYVDNINLEEYYIASDNFILIPSEQGDYYWFFLTGLVLDNTRGFTSARDAIEYLIDEFDNVNLNDFSVYHKDSIDLILKKNEENFENFCKICFTKMNLAPKPIDNFIESSCLPYWKCPKCGFNEEIN